MIDSKIVISVSLHCRYGFMVALFINVSFTRSFNLRCILIKYIKSNNQFDFTGMFYSTGKSFLIGKLYLTSKFYSLVSFYYLK